MKIHNPAIDGFRYGLYFVRTSDKARVYLGKDKWTACWHIEAVCEKYLSESTGWMYTVDRFLGFDNLGRPVWSGIDLSDELCDMAAAVTV